MAKQKVEVDGVLYGAPVKVTIESLGKCPICKKDVIDAKTDYKGGPTKMFNCLGYFQTPRACEFKIWKEFSNKTLSEAEVAELLENGETKQPVVNMKSQKGTIYSSKLQMDKLDNKVKLYREVGIEVAAENNSNEE
jgi:hypothetical protein